MDLLLATTLHALMRKRTWTQFNQVLGDESFPNATASLIYQLLKNLHPIVEGNVTPTMLRMALASEIPPTSTRAQELNEATTELLATNVRNERAVNHAISRYAAKGLAMRSARMVVSHSDSPTFDYAVPAKLLADAARVSSGQVQRAVEIIEAPLPGDADLERRVVSLGLSPELDACLMGGVGNGELLVVLAPPSRGKTSYLWRIATTAAKAGRNVLFVTLEISKRKCYQRFYQCLTHLTNSELCDARDLVQAARDSVTGRLWVQDYSHTKFTPNMLLADVELMRANDCPVDLVVIDYMEIMYPNDTVYGKGGGKHVPLGEMVADLRRVLNQLDIPGVSAWQINRQGADKYVFTREDISECWEVVKIVDIILGLNQGEMEQENNVMRVKVMKQREDTLLPLVYLHSDLRRMIVKPLEDKDVEAIAGTPEVVSGDRPRDEVHCDRVAGRRRAGVC